MNCFLCNKPILVYNASQVITCKSKHQVFLHDKCYLKLFKLDDVTNLCTHCCISDCNAPIISQMTIEELLSDDPNTKNKQKGNKYSQENSETMIISKNDHNISTVNPKYGETQIDDNYLCPICNIRAANRKLIPCGHCFCFDCIVAWRKQTIKKNQSGTRCALCRGLLKGIEVVDIPKSLLIKDKESGNSIYFQPYIQKDSDKQIQKQNIQSKQISEKDNTIVKQKDKTKQKTSTKKQDLSKDQKEKNKTVTKRKNKQNSVETLENSTLNKSQSNSDSIVSTTKSYKRKEETSISSYSIPNNSNSPLNMYVSSSNDYYVPPIPSIVSEKKSITPPQIEIKESNPTMYTQVFSSPSLSLSPLSTSSRNTSSPLLNTPIDNEPPGFKNQNDVVNINKNSSMNQNNQKFSLPPPGMPIISDMSSSVKSNSSILPPMPVVHILSDSNVNNQCQSNNVLGNNITTINKNTNKSKHILNQNQRNQYLNTFLSRLGIYE